MKLAELDLDTLMDLAEEKAKRISDGHLTLMRFTTGWKCCLETPDLYSGEGAERVADLPMFSSLKEALIELLVGESEMERLLKERDEMLQDAICRQNKAPDSGDARRGGSQGVMDGQSNRRHIGNSCWLVYYERTDR